jgi:hypothetical protein
MTMATVVAEVVAMATITVTTMVRRRATAVAAVVAVAVARVTSTEFSLWLDKKTRVYRGFFYGPAAAQ